MTYLSVQEAAEKWGLSARSVRNYCAAGRIAGAFQTGRSWNIPADAQLPHRKPRTGTKPPTLLTILRQEKANQQKGGIYHRIQIDLTYNSNHIEGSRLSHEETRYIYETNTIGQTNNRSINVDDIVETMNHFRCIDRIIDTAENRITEKMTKELHRQLKSGTSDSRQSWFAVGDYKRLPNEVGGNPTCPPEEVATKIKELLTWYNERKNISFDDLLEFHHRFELIHPFQDGNGRVGRLLLFKECLHHKIVPFIITDQLKLFYYRGLANWKNEKGWLRDTCLTAQDAFKKHLDYFRISY